jgi:hypothetical protein
MKYLLKKSSEALPQTDESCSLKSVSVSSSKSAQSATIASAILGSIRPDPDPDPDFDFERTR